MSIQQLKHEADALSDAERSELIHYLVARRREPSADAERAEGETEFQGEACVPKALR